MLPCSWLVLKDSRALELVAVYRGHRWKPGNASSAVISAQPLLCLDLCCPMLQLPAAYDSKKAVCMYRCESWTIKKAEA